MATIQVANSFGAGLGGYVLEAGGMTAPVVAAGVLLALTSLVVLMGVDAGRSPHCDMDAVDAATSTDPRIREPATTGRR